MRVKCNARSCRYQSKGCCTKKEIAMMKVDFFDEYSAECLDYDEEVDMKYYK